MIRRYFQEKFADPIFRAAEGLAVIPFVFAGSYALDYYFDTTLFIYIGIALSVVLSLPFLLLLVVLFLLWKNPHKYKEREMKKWRSEQVRLAEEK